MHEIVAARKALIDAKVVQATDNSPDNMTATYRAEVQYWTLVAAMNPVSVRHEVEEYLAALRARYAVKIGN